MSEHQDIQINTLEINQKNMADKLDKLEATVVKGFDSIMSEFKCIREDSDNKYASKSRVSQLEKVVYGAVTVILLAFMAGLSALVIK